jgi:hypothetical protein
MPLARPAALANSHHDGGRVFLIFVAEPRTEGDAHPPPHRSSRLAIARPRNPAREAVVTAQARKSWCLESKEAPLFFFRLRDNRFGRPMAGQ